MKGFPFTAIRLIVIQSMHFHVGIIEIIERNSIHRAERSRWREKRGFYCAILSIISYMNVFDTRTKAIYRIYSGLANRFFWHSTSFLTFACLHCLVAESNRSSFIKSEVEIGALRYLQTNFFSFEHNSARVHAVQRPAKSDQRKK